MNIERALIASRNGDCPTGETSFYYETLVPKDLRLNLAFRRKMIALGSESEEYRRDLWIMCSRDVLFYVNTFGWTINPKEHADSPLRPFITYGYQDRAIREILESLGERDVALPKSRDMGASWMCLIAMEYRWHFRQHQLFLLTSEKEELVEGPGEKSLFSKLDFWWRHQPWWLRPTTDRVKKHCRNLDNDSSFDGEATVSNMATGDRRTGILMDETSKMPDAKKIFTSTRDVSRSRLFNSTPNGRHGVGEAFYRKVKNPATKKIWIHWTEHPEKSRGLYRLVEGERVPIDPLVYNWRDDYDFNQLCFVGDKVRSPWYDEQVERSESPLEVAQELDLDFLGSSERFADEVAVKIMQTEQVAPPLLEGRISVDPEDLSVSWSRIRRGPVRLWCHLPDGSPPVDSYVFGADVSAGTGGNFSSASTLVGFNSRTGEQVFEYADSVILPEQWCDLSIAVCRWFHDAFFVPEINGGPGTQFLNRLRDVQYQNIYRRKVDSIGYEKETRKLGYFMPHAGPAQLLQIAMAAAKERVITVRSSRIVDELNEYEWKNGKLVHVASNTSEFHSDKGLLHGDVAIAFGCCYLGMRERPHFDSPEPETEPPMGTIGYRWKELDRELAHAGSSDLDFE